MIWGVEETKCSQLDVPSHRILKVSSGKSGVPEGEWREESLRSKERPDNPGPDRSNWGD